jgi:alpha/beta superfamily hydrolase
VNADSRTIRPFFLEGPAGRLEAVLNLGTTSPTYAAVVCHPHPLFGGTLHNKVAFSAMKALHHLGFPVLRFNFRGAGLSQGEHDNGRGEVEDVCAAVEWLALEFNSPIIVAGFSFGAAMGLKAGCPDARVQALVGLGLPVAPVEGRIYDLSFLKVCAKPKLFVSGSDDVFGPAPALEATVNASANPKTVARISGADHFFTGKLDALRQTMQDWLQVTLDLPQPG